MKRIVGASVVFVVALWLAGGVATLRRQSPLLGPTYSPAQIVTRHLQFRIGQAIYVRGAIFSLGPREPAVGILHDVPWSAYVPGMLIVYGPADPVVSRLRTMPII